MDDWIQVLRAVGHEVEESPVFESYERTFESIASSDAVVGIVNRAGGTQWVAELATAIDGKSHLDLVPYSGAKKPTFVQWADATEPPVSWIGWLVGKGAVELPQDFGDAGPVLLSALSNL